MHFRGEGQFCYAVSAIRLGAFISIYPLGVLQRRPRDASHSPGITSENLLHQGTLSTAPNYACRARLFSDPSKIVSSAMKARYSDELAFDIWIELLLNQLAVPGYLEAAAENPKLYDQYMVCATKVEDKLLFLRSSFCTHPNFRLMQVDQASSLALNHWQSL